MVAKKTNKKNNTNTKNKTGAKSGARTTARKIEKEFVKNVNTLKAKVAENIKIDKKDIKESANFLVKFMKSIKMEYVGKHLVKMFEDIKNILINPVNFFSSIKVNGDFATPVKTVVAFGLMSGALSILLTFWRIGFAETITSILLYPIIILISSFLLSGFLLMFAYMTKADMNFEKAYKIVASQAFLFPIGTALYKLMPTWFFLKTASIVMDAYVILLAYLATVYGLKGKITLAQIVFGVFFIMMILFYTTQFSNIWVLFKNPSFANSVFAM